jgi:hypothetical protein
MVLFLHLPEKKLLCDAQCASLHRTVYWRIAALPYVGRQSGSKINGINSAISCKQFYKVQYLPVYYPVFRIRDFW